MLGRPTGFGVEVGIVARSERILWTVRLLHPTAAAIVLILNPFAISDLVKTRRAADKYGAMATNLSSETLVMALVRGREEGKGKLDKRQCGRIGTTARRQCTVGPNGHVRSLC